MQIITKNLEISSKEEFEIINITDKINDIFLKNKVKSGFMNIFSRHTTLALKINEDEKLLMKDFTEFMNILTPEREYHHDKLELRKNCLPNEPKNAKGHLRNLVLETSQVIPIDGSKILLGKYQQIFAIETSGPRKRELIVQIVGE